jgi:hypothetical protein
MKSAKPTQAASRFVFERLLERPTTLTLCFGFIKSRRYPLPRLPTTLVQGELFQIPPAFRDLAESRKNSDQPEGIDSTQGQSR